MTYRWLDYDVWGNEDDGFYVNDVRRSGYTVELPPDVSDTDLLRILRDEGVLNKRATTRTVQIESDDEYSFVLYEKKSMRPVGELRLED